jgi:uracil-DNA glycosylase
MSSNRVLWRLWAEHAAGHGRLRVPRRRPKTDTPAAPAASATPSNPPPLIVSEADSLDRVAAQVAACRRCALGSERTNAVPGEGNPHAAVMFVGEAPGREEDAQGRPFVGPAGQLLTRMIAAMGLAREDVYIANVIKCRPPGNREPAPEEVAACKDYLRRQLALVRPRVVVALGGHATRWFLGASAGITRVRGQIFDEGDVKVVPTFHPSYLLRSPGEKGKAWADLQVVMRLVDLPLPGARPGG